MANIPLIQRMTNSPPTFTVNAFTDMIPRANDLVVITEDNFTPAEDRWVRLVLGDGEIRITPYDFNANDRPITAMVLLEQGVFHVTTFCLECMDGYVIFEYHEDAWQRREEFPNHYNIGEDDPADGGEGDDPADGGEGDDPVDDEGDDQASGFRRQ